MISMILEVVFKITEEKKQAVKLAINDLYNHQMTDSSLQEPQIICSMGLRHNTNNTCQQ